MGLLCVCLLGSKQGTPTTPLLKLATNGTIGQAG